MEGNTRSEAVDHSRRDPDSNSSPSGAPIDGFCAQNSENSAENGNRNDEGQKRSDFYEKNEVRAFAGVGSNNAKYKSMSPARLPISRSPCLTIPPGLSPTSLLDSPILLSNMKAEPSPTTGTFSMPRVMCGAVGDHSFSSPRGATNNSTNDEGSTGDFEFKTNIKPCSISGLSSLGPMASVGSIYQQGMTFAPPPSVPTENVTVASHDLSLSVIPSNPAVFMVKSEARTTVNGHPDEDRQRCVSDNVNHVSQPDHNGPNPSAVVERTSEDGYNWRKYGQKLVKGSEFPRSYYKCTHPNCQVKKQMERSPDGQITEIIYKGKHDHPKPQPSRRFAVGAMLSSQGEERSDCFSLNTEEKPSSAQGQGPNHIETCGTSELSPVSASDEDMEGTLAQPNKVADEIDDEDDPESKRRKKDIGGIDVSPLGKMTREPRVVVQTLSEVDILDDGYRWRKYGQKVVKGNPNPRSYYKCTNAGCPVRKHVERASHDPKAVITTYEGKHNHDVPSARNSSHHTAGPTPLSDANALNGQMTTVLNGMLRTDQPEESDVISLNLGVGISSNSDMRHNKQLTHDEEQVQSQIHMGGPGCGKLVHAAPVSSYYGGGLGGSDQYGTREDQGESFSFNTPPFNHSSAPCRQNLGRLVMGP